MAYFQRMFDTKIVLAVFDKVSSCLRMYVHNGFSLSPWQVRNLFQMTGPPHSTLDSGYCSGLFENRSSFSFEPDDICMNHHQTEDTLRHSLDDSISRPITHCSWTVEDSRVYQRRKRSVSCPTTSRTFFQSPFFQRSQSCHGDSLNERSRRITTMNRRSVETQTFPADGNYCEGCLRIFGAQLMQENPNLPG